MKIRREHDLTKEEKGSVDWAKDIVTGKRLGAGTSHIKNLLDIIEKQFEEIELLSHQKIER
jgi:hypothetical protein